jgi:hypothetical protein
MALTGIENSIVPVLEIDRTVTPTVKVFEDTTRAILDFYATINSAVRLIKRFVYTPEMSGGVWKIAIQEFEYPANYDDTYDPTNLASAVTSPFTIALGTQIGETKYSNNQVMLPTIFLAAGDTLAS